jgi:hypothetical protein
MLLRLNAKSDQRGATLVEFAIGATVFMTAMFAVLEFGRALWTHNALSDAARRGARYAIHQPASTPAGAKTGANDTDVGPSLEAIRNVTVYGNPDGGTNPMVSDLTTDKVHVRYHYFGLGEGTVGVTIEGYQFQFAIPMVGTTITMPDYNTTLTAENAGVMP